MKIFMRRMRSALAPILCGPALAGLMAGLGALASGAAEKPDGAEIFSSRCAMCHGQDGKGYSAVHTPDFTDPKWQASIKDAQILEAIKNGVKDTAMPPFADKLSEQEMLAVLKRVREFGRKR